MAEVADMPELAWLAEPSQVAGTNNLQAHGGHATTREGL